MSLKALNVLRSPIVGIGSDSDINLHNNAVVLFATREQIQEAIAELEALQQTIKLVIEEIEYAIAKPLYAEVYLNNAIRFLKETK